MVEGLVSGGVRLSGGVAASVLLYEVLSDSVRAFPNTFSGLEFPDSSAVFRDRYPSVLPWFEAARADSPDRSQIAEALAREAASKVVWELDGSEMPLAEKVGEKAEPLDLETEMLGVGGGLSPSVVLDGEKREGSDLVAAAAGLVEDGFASRDVLEGVSWIVEEAGSDGINLQDRRIVVMGASAELAPTRLFLAGGADVLWIDLTPPPQELFESEHLSGTGSWVEAGSRAVRTC